MDIMQKLQAQPASQSCRLIDFDKAELQTEDGGKRLFLVVSGEKPTVSMRVELRPLYYVMQPEYWGVEVVGCVSGIVLPAVAPYTEALDVTHTMGTKGIEVIGANKTLRLDK
ncbi:hypothetical protein [Stappia sp. ES.058]|uniref:hypothetical protein n=1 Tax=Stappia sp. ES.058 TaxID=1881061 RepID=UPI0008798470|nr:hypothetical protein [Stappia sp. ES.058]SDT88371.1 hypothetical protein SAMN05428979_0051 [Stappia sp. ES.058]